MKPKNKKIQGNVKPIRLNWSATNVNRQVQRLSIEDTKTNKMLKNIELVSNIPNYPLPNFSGRRHSPTLAEKQVNITTTTNHQRTTSVNKNGGLI